MVCTFCAQERKAQKEMALSGIRPKSFYDASGRFVPGLDQEVKSDDDYVGFPRCPKCKEFIGAASADCEHLTHIHSCSNCGWASDVKDGIYE